MGVEPSVGSAGLLCSAYAHTYKGVITRTLHNLHNCRSEACAR